MKTTLRSVRALAAACLFVAACDNGSPVNNHDSESGYLHGTVYSVTDTVAVAGAQVSLVQAIPYRVVAGPVTTDADGRYEFVHAPIGDWYLFVISGNLFMFDSAQARVSIRPGVSVERDARMIESELWGNSGDRYRGVIVDAETNQPIPGAFVSSMMFGISNSFLGVPIYEAITDSLGQYEIGVSFWMLDYGTLIVAHPFGVTKEGYAPYFILDVPMDDADVDTTYTLNVALHPNTSHGVIRGRLAYGTTYMEGIPVGLDYSLYAPDAPASKTASPRPTSLLGSAVRTGPDGRFAIGDLAPGTYFVDVAFLPDDGFVLLPAEAQRDRVVVELGSDEVVDLGTLHIAKSMRPLYPANGAVVDEQRPTLRWTSVAGAERYRLSAGTAHLLDFSVEVTSPSYRFEAPIPPGTPVRWTVRAMRGECPDCEELSSFEAVATFRVAP